MAVWSRTNRWDEKSSQKVIDAVYDIEGGPRPFLSRGIADSALKYSCFNSKLERFKERGLSNDPIYNTEVGLKKSLANCVQDTNWKYSNMRSVVPRTGVANISCAPLDANYDTDVGTKPSIQKEIETTSLKYSNVRSEVSRFKGKQLPAVSAPDADYDIDSGHKKSLSRGVQESGIRYANLHSHSRRFERGGQRPVDAKNPPPAGYVHDAPEYQIDRAHKSSLARSVRKTGRKYRNVGTSTVRFKEVKYEDAAKDAEYNTDCGNKKSIANAVKESPISYSIVRSTLPRFKVPKKEERPKNSFDFNARRQAQIQSKLQKSL
eukprot:Rmarinus@m.24905